MKRLLIVALSSWALTAAAASAACTGQAGNSVFEDSFGDDSGGWDFSGGTKYSEVKDSTFVLHPNPGGSKETNPNLSIANLTFSAGEGDFCIEFVLPKAVAPDNNVDLGIMFLRQDKNNYYVWQASTDKGVYLFRYSASNWSTLYSNPTPSTQVNLEPGAVNTLRVTVKDAKVALFLNDQQIKVIRAQIPTGELHFGIYTQAAKSSDANPVILVKSFKVTAGP